MRLLNIGAGPKGTPMPPWYVGWEVVRLDVEAEYEPDLLMDAMELDTLEAGQFDAAYASHLLEHVYPFDLVRFLGGVRHVLTEDGFFEVRVPDVLAACERAARAGTLAAVCYTVPVGDITAWDMLYSFEPYQHRYGAPMAHHNGFDVQRLGQTLVGGGFAPVYVQRGCYELRAVACKGDLADDMKERMGIERATGERGPVHPNMRSADVGAVRQFRAVAELPLQPAPGHPGDGAAPAEAAAGGRGALLSGAPGAERGL